MAGEIVESANVPRSVSMKPAMALAALFVSAGHGLEQQALLDRLAWLRERIGLDAVP